MASKRFGPVNDAGVVVKEAEGEKPIEASLYGSSAMAGILERGEVGELITAISKKDLIAKTGGIIPDSVLPDSCKDFWDAGDGAGILFLYRTCDGNQVKSQLTLWDRKSPRNKVVKVEAKNGGGWGGKRDEILLDLSDVSDIAETEITLPTTYVVAKNKWKNGVVTLRGTGGDLTYNITSNTVGDGITASVLTLASDSTADTDFDTSTDTEIVLTQTQLDVWGRDKRLAVEIQDGQVYPDTEWGMYVYLDGELIISWSDLSSDPNASNYFVSVINDADNNYYVEVTDLWAGAVTASIRPANFYAAVDAAEITALGLDISTVAVIVDSSAAVDNTIAAFTFGTKVIPDTYELEYTGAAWELTSLDKQAGHVFPDPVSATPYVADNDRSIGFTVTETTPSSGEKFTLHVVPLFADKAISGKVLFPDESFAPATGWTVSDNTLLGATIISGDMTNGGTISGDINVRLQYPQELSDGFDGHHDIGVNNYTPAFDVGTSPYNDTEKQGYGLIKFATPGIMRVLSNSDAVTVQKAGVAYAETKNHQFRLEFPDDYTDESTAKTWLNNTMGRSDYEKICFPSYGYVSDPIKSGLIKLVSLTGMILGEEAKMARTYEGYFKAAAGEDVKFPKIKKIPTLKRRLNGEVLNPAGIQRVEILNGNFCLWGGRLPYTDPNFKFCIHREYLSYVEHVLQESYAWIVFAINNADKQSDALSSAKSFFLPEWTKGAIRGDSFSDAAIIKIDDENNTDVTMAAGNMNMDVDLKIVDMVERFIITIGKQGIFETVASA